MSATLPTIDASLSPSMINRMDEACDRFEAAWKMGLRPRIEDYLEETAGPERSTLWHELLVLEMVQRFPEEPKHLQDKDLCVHYFAKKSLSWYAPNIRA